jgi:hypothetical protein
MDELSKMARRGELVDVIQFDVDFDGPSPDAQREAALRLANHVAQTGMVEIYGPRVRYFDHLGMGRVEVFCKMSVGS